MIAELGRLTRQSDVVHVHGYSRKAAVAIGMARLFRVPVVLSLHTAGFDDQAGVFRIFDVWETREQGEKFINEQLTPIIERMAAEAADKADDSFTPPTRDGWYDLHDSMTG